ncbi:MAG: HlyD family efflux transporter periplasmic adaptor subunit [Mariniblastus sp.]
MQENESEVQLAVFDSLIDGLADQASDPETQSAVFFSKAEQVLETIVNPKWSAIVATGPDDSALLIHGNSTAKQELAALPRDSKLSQGSWIERFARPDIVVSPIQGSKGVWGWLIVRLAQPNASSVQKDVVAGVAEIAGEFVGFQNQKQISKQLSFNDEVFAFSVNAHRSLDSKEVGHFIANDARTLLGCERVSVFSVDQGRPRLLTVSSVANVEGRTELVRNMNSLIARACRKNEPIFSDQVPTDPRLAALLENHIAKTGLPFVFAVPIFSSDVRGNRSKRQLSGYLFAESTEEIDRFQFARAISHVVPHAQIALTNAGAFGSIPFRRSLSGVGKLFRFANLSRFGAVVGLLALVVIASMLIKTDFKVRINGELRPVVERNIFAPYTGVVDSVHVSHGDQVSINQPLIQIRSTDLDLEIETTVNEMQKLEQLKDAKRIALNQVSGANADPNVTAQLASDLSDLDFQKSSLVEKQKFLLSQREKLSIVSPIEGQVMTWQVKQNLTNKPIRWGDPMLKVANLNGEWNLVFRVPERRIGYILDAANDTEESVELEFFLESNPAKKYRVAVVEIGQSAIQDSKLGAVTLVKCNVPSELLTKRQGATITGDVFCGSRSIWFVWTREMFDAVKRRFVL